MKSFKKPNRFSGNSGRDSGRPSERSFKKFEGKRPDRFGGSSDKPRRSFDSRESKSGNGFKLYEAVCDKCGKNCEIPFQPTGGKPIYCRSCFRENSGNPSSGNFKEFQPRERGDRFESRSNPKFERDFESKDSSVSVDDLAKINRKLDKIMKALKIE